MTLTEIEADMIAGKRNAVQKKIGDFFAPSSADQVTRLHHIAQLYCGKVNSAGVLTKLRLEEDPLREGGEEVSSSGAACPMGLERPPLGPLPPSRRLKGCSKGPRLPPNMAAVPSRRSNESA
ncbi:hypothetical protein HPB52_025260 [Rhipicephalus sanguineus]|uniref:Uncharacterized protein n=1 Tax=Rhipicephalus sanguineus TaxID=34632 RepID=A0A9D4YRN5_RHISA|nr:hypothetical protein HPB52_025260 [Rhipicephalus sanguineus]